MLGGRGCRRRLSWQVLRFAWRRPMSWPFIALLLIIGWPLYSQEEDRKPSPFPEKNREREAAARKISGSSHPKQRAGDHARTEKADRPDGASIGKACFFSPKHGDPATASGVDANADEFAAASATYALGTLVRVTNLANEKAVEVKIIDRLSDSRRIISVSEGAARRLGFYELGIATVKVEEIWSGEPRR